MLSSARILVAGAGAVGNETLKNLALLGVGTIGIIDRDVVEVSNLSRTVLFLEGDIGQPKALVAASRLRLLNPGLQVHIHELDLTTQLGAGSIERYDLDGQASAASRIHACRPENRAGYRPIAHKDLPLSPAVLERAATTDRHALTLSKAAYHNFVTEPSIAFH